MSVRVKCRPLCFIKWWPIYHGVSTININDLVALWVDFAVCLHVFIHSLIAVSAMLYTDAVRVSAKLICISLGNCILPDGEKKKLKHCDLFAIFHRIVMDNFKQCAQETKAVTNNNNKFISNEISSASSARSMFANNFFFAE